MSQNTQAVTPALRQSAALQGSRGAAGASSRAGSIVSRWRQWLNC